MGESGGFALSAAIPAFRFLMNKEWLIFCTGVVPAISSIVRKMTTVAEKIVLLTPVYNIF